MTAPPAGTVRARLHELYYGDGVEPRRFRFFLLGFDIITILFFVVSSMFEPTLTVFVVDFVIAAVLIADYVARMSIANRPWSFMLRFTSIMDAIVIVSLLLAFLIDNLAFLRVVRMLRLVRSYHVLADLRRRSRWFRQNEEVVGSALNLAIFVFVITAIVFVVEGNRNPNIKNYVDALYFTVTTLTTTGFGDITMTDTPGRILAVVIMIFGVSLFLVRIRRGPPCDRGGERRIACIRRLQWSPEGGSLGSEG